MDNIQNDVNNGLEGNQTESSTVEAEELQKLKEENQRLKENLRNQSKKRESLTGETVEEIDEEIESRLEKIAEQKINEKLAEKTQLEEKSALQQFLSTDIGKNYANDGDPKKDKKYMELQKVYKALEQAKGVALTSEEKLKRLQLAHVVVSEEFIKEEKSEGLKQAVSGPGSSSIKNESVKEDWSQFTARERELLERRGLKPSDVAKAEGVETN